MNKEYKISRPLTGFCLLLAMVMLATWLFYTSATRSQAQTESSTIYLSLVGKQFALGDSGSTVQTSPTAAATATEALAPTATNTPTPQPTATATETPAPTATNTPTPQPTARPDVLDNEQIANVCLSADEINLAAALNAYRTALGLPTVPTSKSLSLVAQTHTDDLVLHSPDTGTDSRGVACSPHSWSDQGHWEPVCYTMDHINPQGMWHKPDEVTNGAYDATGFEILVVSINSSGTAVIDVESAMDAWIGSEPHRQLFAEEGVWEGSNWAAVGVGMQEGYAIAWYAKDSDPYGSPLQCK